MGKTTRIKPINNDKAQLRTAAEEVAELGCTTSDYIDTKVKIETLVKHTFVIPEFQRDLCWTPAQRSMYIISILDNHPLATAFTMARIIDPDVVRTRTHESFGSSVIMDGLSLIDGYQRYTTLKDFYQNKIALNFSTVAQRDVIFKLYDSLSHIQTLPQWARTTQTEFFFKELPVSIQGHFKRKELAAWVGWGTPLSCIDAFLRLNNGTALSTREKVRAGLLTVDLYTQVVVPLLKSAKLFTGRVPECVTDPAQRVAEYEALKDSMVFPEAALKKFYGRTQTMSRMLEEFTALDLFAGDIVKTYNLVNTHRTAKGALAFVELDKCMKSLLASTTPEAITDDCHRALEVLSLTFRSPARLESYARAMETLYPRTMYPFGRDIEGKVTLQALFPAALMYLVKDIDPTKLTPVQTQALYDTINNFKGRMVEADMVRALPGVDLSNLPPEIIAQADEFSDTFSQNQAKGRNVARGYQQLAKDLFEVVQALNIQYISGRTPTLPATCSHVDRLESKPRPRAFTKSQIMVAQDKAARTGAIAPGHMFLTESDHANPWAEGGATTQENLALAFKSANRADGAKLAHERRKQSRVR